MHFPVVLRYTPTKWIEAQYNRPEDSPSKFVTLNYQNKDSDSVSPSPTKKLSATAPIQPLYAVAPTARKRYLQALSAESFQKPVHESLRDMTNYGEKVKTARLAVVEADWYLDVTNVAQRLKLLRETYKVIQSVRKKKLMGERADFQSLFDLRLPGNSSPHSLDDDRHSNLRSEDDDEYAPVQRPPPIPNRRGRPRKKRGVDRKPPMARSDHKRTRASLRRNASREVPSSPAERGLHTSEAPEAFPDDQTRYNRSDKEDTSSSSQNERSATPRSPHSNAFSQASTAASRVGSSLHHFYEHRDDSVAPNSSPDPHDFAGVAGNGGSAIQSSQSDPYSVYAPEDRNILEKITQSLQEDMKQEPHSSSLPTVSGVPLSSTLTQAPYNPTVAAVPEPAINSMVSLPNGDTNIPLQRTTSSSTADLLNEIYSRADEAPLSASSYGNVSTENGAFDDRTKGYSELLRELDEHLLGDTRSQEAPQQVPYQQAAATAHMDHNTHTANSGYTQHNAS